MAKIFVFGSNLAGRHGKGAALCARREYGAEYGVGSGRTGDAYAIPTKDVFLHPLPLSWITAFVDVFLIYARNHPEDTFLVTRVGCGLAGCPGRYCPMFHGPQNCQLSEGW